MRNCLTRGNSITEERNEKKLLEKLIPKHNAFLCFLEVFLFRSIPKLQ